MTEDTLMKSTTARLGFMINVGLARSSCEFLSGSGA